MHVEVNCNRSFLLCLMGKPQQKYSDSSPIMSLYPRFYDGILLVYAGFRLGK